MQYPMNQATDSIETGSPSSRCTMEFTGYMKIDLTSFRQWLTIQGVEALLIVCGMIVVAYMIGRKK